MYCIRANMREVLYFLILVILDCRTVNSKPPNIVLFISDDVGFNDHGFHGSNQIPTPNIDSLAYNGVILDKFYTQQTCTPSRAALLTGNYPIRSGMQGSSIKTGEDRHLPLDMPTLPEMLKKLGYRTHLVGKWHLGYGHTNYTPTERGFDTHFGYWNGFCGYFNYEIPSDYTNFLNKPYYDLHDNLMPEYESRGKYSTDVFTEKAIETIDKHNISEPMLLVISHLAGHTGYDGFELGVPNVTKTKEKFWYIKNSRRQLYADVINLMDESIGKTVNKLSERGMLENSIIIYLSDNGAQTIGLYANEASSWPFRGLKSTLYEGGVRGSCVIFSPLLEKAPYINNELIHMTDLMPTLYYAAGGDVADLGDIDGINQWEVLSKNQTTNRTEILLNIDEKENFSGILGYNGQYKLLKGSFKLGIYDQYYGDSGRSLETPPYDFKSVLENPVNIALQKLSNSSLDEESIIKIRAELDRGNCRNSAPFHFLQEYYLYDIYTDPCETKNIIADENNAQIVQTLKAKLDKYYQEIVPQGNTEPDPKSNPKNCNETWYPWLDLDGCFLKSATNSPHNCISNFVHWLVDETKNVVNKVINIIQKLHIIDT